MDIPEGLLERRKWMLKLWREDYGAQLAVFDPEDQSPSPSWKAGNRTCGCPMNLAPMTEEIFIQGKYAIFDRLSVPKISCRTAMDWLSVRICFSIAGQCNVRGPLRQSLLRKGSAYGTYEPSA